MSETYINEQRLARQYAQDFLAATSGTQQVSVSQGGVRVTMDRAGREIVDRVCTGCSNDIPGNCAAATRGDDGHVRFPEEPCYQAKGAA